jgi:hypothetical protein
VKDYIYRMQDERRALAEKMCKLMGFRSYNSKIIDDTERYLLRWQSDVMDAYIEILDARISHAILKEQKEDEK